MKRYIVNPLLILAIIVLLGSMFSTPVAGARTPQVSWVPETIEVDLFPGTSSVETVTFMSDQDLSDVSLWVVPGLQKILSVEPLSFASINATTPYSAALFFSIPSDTAYGSYNGTIHIKIENKTVPQTLKVILNVVEPTAEDIPDGVALPSLDRIYMDPETGPEYVLDEVTIGFVLGTAEDNVKSLVKGINGRFLGSIPELDVYQVQIPMPEPGHLDQLIEQLDTEEVVSFAIRHQFYDIQKTPNDPNLGFWDETNPDGNNWGYELINMPSAWDIETEAAVNIAIIDNGFYLNHEDFGNNIFYSLPSNQTWDHGTAVAGIVGAVGNNGIGITGVAWDSSLLLLSAPLPGDPTKLDATLALFLMHLAAEGGAKIINGSWGEQFDNFNDLDRANRFWGQFIKAYPEVLCVFAAGNEGKLASFHSPSCLAEEERYGYKNVISVAAVDKNGDLSEAPWWWPEEWPFGKWKSNFGQSVTVAAPGGDGKLPSGQEDILVLEGLGYGYSEGTSMAAPFVTGLAGLIWSVNPDLTAAEVKQLIIDGAVAGDRQVPGHSFYIINAYESVRLAQVVHFPDPNLEAAIRGAISKPTGVIYQSDLVGLVWLYAHSSGIKDLTGLEYCTSLRNLYLRDNQINNLSPLSSLTNLGYLYLQNNQISNLSPLSSLTDLRELYLQNNQISNLSGLSSLTSLEDLYLQNNPISNLSPLSSLTGLTGLYLGNNQISNLSPLSSLTGLRDLTLVNNQISNLSPLSSLTGLRDLYLNNNHISNLTPLSSLTDLRGLHLNNNQISNLSPLSSLSSLTRLHLADNHISNLSPLSTLTSLTTLDLNRNPISDLSPLYGLPNLWALDLVGTCTINLEQLDGLPNLLALQLGGCPISSIEPLTELINLDTLIISDTYVLSNIGPLAELMNLQFLDLTNNQISNISPLSTLTDLRDLYLSNNQITDIKPLVDNIWLADGVVVYLGGNPLSPASIGTYIPQLQARGVIVSY